MSDLRTDQVENARKEKVYRPRAQNQYHQHQKANKQEKRIVVVPHSGSPMIRKTTKNWIAEALAIEAEEAKKAGALGFMARALVMATMPHSKQEGNEFRRENGALKLVMLAPSDIGLPYGVYPRLLLTWLTTEAVRTKSEVLELGPSLSKFMAELGLIPTGGKEGSIHRLRDQINRLFCCAVSCRYSEEFKDAGNTFTIAHRFKLLWHPRRPDQGLLWHSTVTLSREFFNDIVKHPVPIDLRALKLLKRSPLAVDTYCWLTHRMSYLKKPTVILWEALQMQFGADYPLTPKGKQNFKTKFIERMRKVLAVYPAAKVSIAKRGLRIAPSPPHVLK